MRTLLLSIVLCSTLHAQELTLQERVPEHNLVRASVTNIPPEAAIFWDVFGPLRSENFFTEYFSCEGQNQVVFTGKPGTYAVRLRVFTVENGAIRIILDKMQKMEIVPEGSTPPPPDDPDDPDDPPPPDDPDDPPPVSFIDQVETWTNQVNDPQNAQALAIIYAQVRDSLTSGDITFDQGFQAVQLATDALLSLTGSTVKWENWRSNVSDHIALLRQQGNLTTAADLAVVYNQIQQGLEQGATGSRALSINTITRLIDLFRAKIKEVK